MDLTQRDIAWTAGLFEGEGCISLYPDKRRPGVWLRWIGLGMTDEDVVRRFHMATSAGAVNYRPSPARHPDWSPCWYWQTARWGEIDRLLNMWLPYFGSRRRAKALEMLSHPPTAATQGQKVTAERVREIRDLYAAGGISQGALAQRFGITQSAISRIVTGRNWSHV